MPALPGAVCQVCGASAFAPCGFGLDYLSPAGERYELSSCGSCGFVRMGTPPSAPENELYPDAYYRKMSGFSRALELLFLGERRAAVEGRKTRGAVLDIGCGSGEFLRVMSDAGWTVSGVEPSHFGAGSAPEGVHHGTLESAAFPAASFDAITMWQVLEHIPDPAAALSSARVLLKDDGFLLVSVPNISSLQARFGRDLWFSLDLPRHIWHFSPSTLLRLLEKSGFRVEETRHFSMEYGPYGWWQTLLNIAGCEPNFAYKFLKRGVTGRSPGRLRRAWSAAASALLGLPLLPAAFLLAAAEAACGAGGVITAVAVKK